MAEGNPYSDDYDGQVEPPPRTRGVDPVALVAGVLTLLVSAYVLSDGASWLPVFDLRWVLAGGAVLVGVLMLAASLRGGHKTRRLSDDVPLMDGTGVRPGAVRLRPVSLRRAARGRRRRRSARTRR